MRTRTKRVRKAVELPDFEVAELPRTAIRKKPRPKQSPKVAPAKAARAKRLVLKTVPGGDGEGDEEVLAEEEVRDELEMGDFTDVMEDMMVADFAPLPVADFQPPQFDDECAPKSNCWTVEEDAVLKREMKTLGHVWGKWALIALQLPGRSGKQCRERWHNCLDPHISNHPWTPEEDLIIQMGVQAHGHKWTWIASKLKGRTDNAVKNRYNTTIATAVGRLHRADEERREWSDAAFLRELRRRNAVEETKNNPSRFSKRQVALLAEEAREAFDEEEPTSPGSRWTNDEHARLAYEIPRDVPADQLVRIDWVAASRAVPTRNPSSCRKHWERYLQGLWKPATPEAAAARNKRKSRAASPPPPPPQPPPPPPAVLHTEPMEPVPPAPSAPSPYVIDQLAKHANDPNLHLLAIEDYSEGTDGSWTRSSVLVVGKPGLNFEFPAWGKTAPPPPPQADVIARPVSPMKTETAERWEWMMKTRPQLQSSAGVETVREIDALLSSPPPAATKETSATTAFRGGSSDWRSLKQYYKEKKLRYTEATDVPKATAEELVQSVFV